MKRNNRLKKRLGDQSLPGKASIMAQEHDQESTKRQKPALNEIQPGMEVEDTGHELGESDISKPQVTAVIRDEQGQVKYLIVSKGLLFKKKVVVPVSRIKEVKLEPENKKGSRSTPRTLVSCRSSRILAQVVAPVYRVVTPQP